MAIFHPNIIHGSPPNHSSQRRAGLTIRYSPPSAECTDPEQPVMMLRGEADPAVPNVGCPFTLDPPACRLDALPLSAPALCPSCFPRRPQLDRLPLSALVTSLRRPTARGPSTGTAGTSPATSRGALGMKTAASRPPTRSRRTLTTSRRLRWKRSGQRSRASSRTSSSCWVSPDRTTLLLAAAFQAF